MSWPVKPFPKINTYPILEWGGAGRGQLEPYMIFITRDLSCLREEGRLYNMACSRYTEDNFSLLFQLYESESRTSQSNWSSHQDP